VLRTAGRLLERRYVQVAGIILLLAAAASVLTTPYFDSFRRTPQIARIRPITSFPGNEMEPAFSPEGDRVAYVGNSAADNLDLYVKLIDSGEPVRLTRSPESERAPAWSPDGTRIAFLRFGSDGCRLMVMPALGGSERSLTECARMPLSPGPPTEPG
jgi:Tol biopolymer transport system component